MNYDKFAQILDDTVFGKSKTKLLANIANSPRRFIGLFRPTLPKAKIVQNLLHSGESKFGDALEKLIRLYLEEHGCESLERNVRIGGKRKNLDLCFRKDGIVYFAEQKIRDDHDSTKIPGQFGDFEMKLQKISEIYGTDKVHGIIFFVDPGLCKNQKFYKENLSSLREQLGVKTFLVYGSQFFDLVLRNSGIWEDINKHLARWREQLREFPEFNYDENPEKSFQEIKGLGIADSQRLFENEEICEYILPILFPTGETLKMLADDWDNKPRRREISKLIRQRIATMENNIE